MLRRGTEYLSDIPSAALLVGVMIVIWREFQRPEGPSYRLLWIAPWALLAFYLRYQSILSIGFIAVVSTVLWLPKIRRHPGPVVTSVAIGVIGFCPHALHAIRATGSPLGIIVNTGQAAVREFVGEGLVDYVSLAFSGAGGFVWPITTMALVSGTYLAGKQHDGRKKYWFLLLPALGQTLALGAISHGELRFIFFPVALGIVGGLLAIEEWISRQEPTTRDGAVIALGILLIGSVGISAAAARSSVEGRILSNEPVQLASELVSGGDCGALTSYLPQVTYYSRCFTSAFGPGTSAEAQLAALAGSRKFMILIDGGKRQPFGDDLADLIALTEGAPLRVDGKQVGAEVFMFPEE